jgi:hypothetical protein
MTNDCRLSHDGTPTLPPAFNWPVIEDIRRIRLLDDKASILTDEGSPVYAIGGDEVCVPAWQAAEIVARGLGEWVAR